MKRRERLLRTLRGEPVDRPAVNFYEIGSSKPDTSDPDPFNVYNDPSWKPLLELAEEKTDLIRQVCPKLTPTESNPRQEFFTTSSWMENGSRFIRTTIDVAGRTLTCTTRRDPEVNTVWTLEHFLKDIDDLKAYLELPDEVLDFRVDVSHFVQVETDLGDAGILMVDTGDPLCQAAELFSMADYTVIALTESELFHRLLQKLAPSIQTRTKAVAEAAPGHLWRIYGPEFATPPYLPPRLFEEYVVRYTSPMIKAIQSTGGFARIHSHGRIKDVLPHIVAMGADGTDPIEPPPQGDVNLADVRQQYGNQLVLFGNLEVTDIENLDPGEFEKVVAQGLADGTTGDGRGFVLMPSASPYGREITARTMKNYETMVRLATGQRP